MKKNLIKHIFTNSNQIYETKEEIDEPFRAYFINIFTFLAPTIEDIDRCIYTIESKVFVSMNKRKNAAYTKNEVKDALKHMGPLKSLGPDGFCADFF